MAVKIFHFLAILCAIGLGMASNAYAARSELQLAGTGNYKAPPSSIKQTINVEITTHLGDNQTFREGDVISFLMSLDKDAYVLILFQDARNHLYQIIPNQKHRYSFYKAGLFIQIPERGSEFKFSIRPPFGTENLIVFAHEKPLPRFTGKILAGGIRKLSQPLPNVVQRIHAHVQRNSAGYGEARLQIKTVQAAPN